MNTFKVICKRGGWGAWVNVIPTTKMITSSRLFGLIKTNKVVSENEIVHGPEKEEVCIVIDSYIHQSIEYYKLAGYPYGGYDSRYFVRFDELNETQKEIAEKAEVVLN